MDPVAPLRSSAHVDRLAALLDEVPWAAQTSRLQALNFDFAVRSTDVELGSYLDRILGQFASSGVPAHRYSLIDRGKGPKRYVLYFDQTRLGASSKAAAAFGLLLWHVNRQVVQSAQRYLLFHASAAEYEGAALLFPAPMESGKTTLVAGLVRAGLRYVTDEVVAVDPASLAIDPFPRALSLDEGSWPVLADLEPQVLPSVAHYVGRHWFVEPDAIRVGAISPRCQPRFVITPRYVAGAVTELMPVPPAEGAVVLAQNSFNFAAHGRQALTTVAEMARRCACYRLTVGDLGAACELVLGLLDTGSGSAPASRVAV